MSNENAIARAAGLTVPKGEALGEFETYPEAQALVDRLAKAEFDVSKVWILGNDLKTVEHVTGKLSYGRAALSGAANGAFIGLFFSLLFTLFTPDVLGSFRLMAAIVLITTAVGIALSLISYALVRRRRDFSSTQQVLASSYQVIVAPEFVGQARQALAAGPAE